MELSVTALIVILEVFLVLGAGCGLLVMQNRRLRALTNRLQDRMGELVGDIREYQAQQISAAAVPAATGPSYVKNLELQLNVTRQYHQTLAAGHDIALDLDVETPAPRRVVALRYAMLIAERDAVGDKTDDEPDWDKLFARYQQLIAYYTAESEGAEESTAADSDEVGLLREELQSYKKRIINLERFKALYFELESRWSSCKEEAETRYNELSEIGAQLDDPSGFEEALENYHSAYKGIADLIEQDVETIVADSASARAAQQATGEIRHLRNVAADQHRIIHDLQRRLAEASSQDETAEVVKLLQEELDKQLRYAQESDTCIQLLEDEVASAHREAEQAKGKLQELGLVKAEFRDIQAQKQQQEKILYALKGENQRLKNKLRALSKASPQQTPDPGVKKELTDLKVKYAELEERYLDLKLQS